MASKLQVTASKLQVTASKLQVTASKLQVTPTKLQVTRSKLTSLTAETNKTLKRCFECTVNGSLQMVVFVTVFFVEIFKLVFCVDFVTSRKSS